MGNILKTRLRNDSTISERDDESIFVHANSIFGTGIIHASQDSLGFSDEEPSYISTSSCTKPTVFNSQDTAEHSSQPKAEDVESVIISFEQLEVIFEQYKVMHPESSEVMLPSEVIEIVAPLFQRWQTDLVYNFEIYKNYAKNDKNTIKMFGEFLHIDNYCDFENQFLHHSIGIIITYKMILDGIKQNEADELIEQLAIGHGLHGITGEDFKILDLHLTTYLLQRNLINDESIIAIVGFFFTISDKITKVLNNRRSAAQSSFSAEIPVVGRSSIIRDNYRCMKKWAMITPVIQSKIELIQRQIKMYRSKDKAESDTTTISTQKLKANNFLCNIFHRKKAAKQ